MTCPPLPGSQAPAWEPAAAKLRLRVWSRRQAGACKAGRSQAGAWERGGVVALAALLALVFATPAEAHKLFADCHVKGDRVEIEAYFDDDTPAAQAQVKIVDQAKKTIAEGKTD